MKVGDLVRVKGALLYNTYMKSLVGHIGIVVSKDGFLRHRTAVFIQGKTRRLITEDLEVIDEGGRSCKKKV
tara:strand:- start:209 stop:421 length:213 start_codon:yes stop_codon:yes gene_type:complete